MNNERNLEARAHLIAALRTERTIAVTGAGVSAWAGYGTWWDVLHHLADTVERHSRGAIPNAEVIIQNNPDPLHCARELGIHLGPRFADFIRTEFGPNNAAIHDVILRIVNLPFTHILTFNFETSCERAHDVIGRAYTTISTSSQADFLLFLREMDTNPCRRRVVHLHGLYNDPVDRIVLTNTGYGRLYRDSFFTKALWSLLVSKQLVFMGFGFNDRAFEEALRHAAWDVGEGQDSYHFAIIGLWPEDNDDAVRHTHNDTYKIEPVFYEIRGDREHPDHSGFVEIINGIFAEIGAVALPRQAADPQRQPHSALQPDPQDLERARQLGDALIERADPNRGNDV